MFRVILKPLLILMAAAALLAPAFFAAASSAADGDEVLARVDGQTVVTRAEILDLVAADLMKLERQRHELITNAVKGRVQEILTEREAQNRGITMEELLETEVDGKVAAIPAEKVDRFYSSRRLRQPKESVEPQIRRYLAYQQFIEGLENKASIELLVEPFRVEVADDGPSKGRAEAPVTIVEFGDFECPPCGQTYPVLKKIREDYGKDVRFVFRQFPLRSIHPNAQKAGEASLCAADQGKFWELHDKMFENQKNLGVDGLKSMAAEIAGLDATAFNQCLDEEQHADTVEKDVQEGAKAGVGGTPAFFINGRFVSGALSYEMFAEMIDEELGRGKDEDAGP